MERSPLSKDAEHMLEGHFPRSHGDISILRQGLPPATALSVENYKEGSKSADTLPKQVFN